MTHVAYVGYLDASWTADGGAFGRFDFAFVNLSDRVMEGFRLGYTSVTLNLDPDCVSNAKRVLLDGSCHEFAPPDGMVLKPGESWHFSVGGLMRVPRHFNDGATAAYIVLPDQSVLGVHCGDLTLESANPLPPAPDMPDGRLDVPVGILPWPQVCRLDVFAPPPSALFSSPDATLEDIKAMVGAGELARRLVPVMPAPFVLTPASGGLAIAFVLDTALGPEGYELHFAPDNVQLSFSTAKGRWYGLVTLAQMLRAARHDPTRFAFPRGGVIMDAPRHGWRGCHLDVSRQAMPISDVRRLVDILAWHKMNLLHWHLTDDEGWRIEIEALPELRKVASRRGPGEKLTAQLGTGAEPVACCYSQVEARDLVAHAARMHVDIMPEIDVPGHSAALLAAYPQLRDPDEPDGAYWSGQGFPNNALNPAVEESYDLLKTIFSEIAGIFPFEYLHIGGDEVAPEAWRSSPRAQALMKLAGLADTRALQAHFLRRVQAILTGLDRRLAGWNEVAKAAGVERDGTLLIAWERTRFGPELAREGYDVVMAPGEAYYLDMARSEAFLAPGHHWAGTVPPEKTYSFEAAEHFPPDLLPRLKGIEAGIWAENLTSRERFNYLVFPRLGAVAEAAWTEAGNKDWLRFCAQSRLMPQL